MNSSELALASRRALMSLVQRAERGLLAPEAQPANGQPPPLPLAALTTMASDNYQTNSGAGATTAAQQRAPSDEPTFGDWWAEYWSRQPFPSGYTQSSITLLACFISTIIFLIVVGNLLVCIAIFTEKSLKPTQNWFIASLAVSDMLLGLVVMPFSLARELMGFWIFGPLWCDIHEAVDVLLTTASINTLCLISLDRYWSITQAVKYLKKRTPRRGALMIAFVWIFSAAVSLPPLFGWKKQNTTPSLPPANGSSTVAPGAATGEPDAPATEPEPLAADGELDDESSPAAGAAEADEFDARHRKRRRRRRRPEDTDAPDGSRLQPQSASGADRADPLGYIPLASQFQLLDGAASHSNYHTAASLARLLQAQQQQQPQQQLQQQQQVQSQAPQIEYPQCQLSDDVGYVLYSALGSFFIPCSVMVFTYIKIFLAARSRARRAINKQSRAQQAADKAKRLAANRRTIAGAFSGQGHAAGNRAGRPAGDSGAPSNALAPTNSSNGAAGEGHQVGLISARDRNTFKPQASNEPAMSIRVGKLVVIDRRRSVATPTSGVLADQTTTTANTTTSPVPLDDGATEQTTTGDEHDGSSSCVLTTSGAKQASPSALQEPPPAAATTASAADSSNTNQSSMITVMSGSLAELPVTYFNFKPQAAATGEPSAGPQLPDKAASLLKAIQQAAAVELEAELEEVLASPQLPATPKSELGQQPAETTAAACDTERQQVENAAQSSTNETCFMNMEEDSDNFDAQTGRTILMVAGNAKQSANSLASCTKSQGMLMTMMPAGCTSSGSAAQTAANSQTIVCNNVACLRRRAGLRSAAGAGGSSYCGSSIDDDDDDEDDDDDDGEDEDDDEEDGDVEEEEEDDEDDECVDDDLLTDECNGYSGSCGLDHYCPAATSSTCVHCQCDEDVDVVVEHTDRASKSIDQLNTSGTTTTTDSPLRDHQHQPPPKHTRHHQHHLQHHRQHHHHHQSPRQHRRPASNQRQRHEHSPRGAGCGAACETEVQSLTCDDNLSSTEYRSNEEENSSIVGHDVLDATPADRSLDRKRKSVSGQSGAGDAAGAPPVGVRKKSSIGQRLARLGSSVPPLTTQSGGLLALAAASQQQQSAAAGAGGPTRNLKALRQNFFHKLNQLTAKSAVKQQSKSRALVGQTTGAHSSGSSFEPSVDCATTSNVHSVMDHYHQETTFGETDDYEPPTSGDTSNTRDQPSSNEPQTGGQQRQPRMSIAGSGRAALHHTNSKKSSKSNAHDNQLTNHHSGKDRAYLMLQDSPGEAANRHLLSADDDSILARSASINKSLRIDLGGTLKDSAALGSPIVARKQSARFERSPAAGGLAGSSTSGDRSLAAGGRQMATTRAYLASDNERHKRKLAKARERRATLILGLIMTAFICAWLPFFTFYLLRAFCQVCREFVSPRFEAFIFWMGYCNSAINPIIYTIFNRDFRKAFRKILFKCL